MINELPSFSYNANDQLVLLVRMTSGGHDDHTSCVHYTTLRDESQHILQTRTLQAAKEAPHSDT